MLFNVTIYGTVIDGTPPTVLLAESVTEPSDVKAEARPVVEITNVIANRIESNFFIIFTSLLYLNLKI